MKNSEVNVFNGIPTGPDEADLVRAYLGTTDWTPGSRRGFAFDLRKLATWFVEAYREPFRVARVTTRDVTDFREHLRRDKGLGERSGSAVLRHGKGNKEQSVPLPLPARRALQAYLDVRPPVGSKQVFVGERGPWTALAVRGL
jgi:integrase